MGKEVLFSISFQATKFDRKTKKPSVSNGKTTRSHKHAFSLYKPLGAKDEVVVIQSNVDNDECTDFASFSASEWLGSTDDWWSKEKFVGDDLSDRKYWRED